MRKTLVYIDDDAEDREIFCEAVSLMEDIDCIAVSSCDPAVKTMKAQHVDIIFLNYRMPHVDGPQCLAKINVIRSSYPGLQIHFYATFCRTSKKRIVVSLVQLIVLKNRQIPQKSSSL